MNRSIIAFLVAPLTVPVLLLPYIRALSNTFGISVFALEIATVMAYAGAILFGVPAYSFLRARDWTAPWIALIFGFAIGAAMWVVFMVIFALSLGEGASGVLLALTNLGTLKGAVWPGGITGAVTGIIFWMIARPDRQKRRSLNRTADDTSSRRLG